VLTAAIAKAGYKVTFIYGDVSPAQRNKVFGEFNDTRDVEVIVAVPKVMAHGLTLTAASCTVWYTPYSDADVFIQANNRMDRPGQMHSMEIISLCGNASEVSMYDHLEGLVSDQHDVLSHYGELVATLS
jgi:superfamily II DNA/RNA helicase